jgi:hypothetical protein
MRKSDFSVDYNHECVICWSDVTAVYNKFTKVTFPSAIVFK